MKEGIKVYPRVERTFYGMSNDELREAMIAYTNQVTDGIIEELEDEFGIRLEMDESGEMKAFLKFAIDKAFTKGMELAEYPRELAEFHKKMKNKSAFDMVKTYEFEESKGVSGVLFPDGTFRMCGNAEHNLVMGEIPMEVQFGCLYFSSTMRFGGDGVITHSPIKFNGVTEGQRYWMEMNFDYLDRGQQRRAHFDWGIRKDD